MACLDCARFHPFLTRPRSPAAVATCLAFPLQGLRYRLGDFSVAVARGVQKPLEEFRGIVVEVAYCPLSSSEAAAPVLQVRPILLFPLSCCSLVVGV